MRKELDLARLHTTPLGERRIRQNLGLPAEPDYHHGS